jgi:hypothetical protein
MFFACMLAWLLSQIWAMNTASKPNTTANPIMTMVLARTAVLSRLTRPETALVYSRKHYRAGSIQLLKSVAQMLLC